MSIDVNPATAAGKLPVITEVIDGEHYPIYKQSVGVKGEQTPISKENPMPVEQKLSHETDIVTVLNDISRKLSILIEYESMLHKINLEEG